MRHARDTKSGSTLTFRDMLLMQFASRAVQLLTIDNETLSLVTLPRLIVYIFMGIKADWFRVRIVRRMM